MKRNNNKRQRANKVRNTLNIAKLSEAKKLGRCKELCFWALFCTSGLIEEEDQQNKKIQTKYHKNHTHREQEERLGDLGDLCHLLSYHTVGDEIITF